MLDAILAFDHEFLIAVQEIHTPFLDTFFKFFTSLGNAGLICIILTLIMLTMKKTRFCGISCALSLIYDLLLCNIILKPLFERPRPYEFFTDFSAEALIISAPSDFSFPSGHTAACFAFSAALFMHNKKLGIIAYVFSAIMGFSRLYLGVHYPTDIFGGIIVGIVCGIIAYHTNCKFIKKHLSKSENNN